MKFDILNVFEIVRTGSINELVGVLKKGFDINIKDDEGGTLLLIAIAYDNEEMALLLLEHGADASIQDNDGLNALHYVAGNHMFNIAKVILEKQPETLHMENKNGARPLYLAVHNAKRPFDMIKLFLKKGADKDHGDDYSALNRAKRYKTRDVEILFEDY